LKEEIKPTMTIGGYPSKQALGLFLGAAVVCGVEVFVVQCKHAWEFSSRVAAGIMFQGHT
jgi:hypothetical protein